MNPDTPARETSPPVNDLKPTLRQRLGVNAIYVSVFGLLLLFAAYNTWQTANEVKGRRVEAPAAAVDTAGVSATLNVEASSVR